jgi:hypothetical protein
MLNSCFCCGGALFNSLNIKVTEEEGYICIDSAGGCGFAIGIINKKVTFCKIPIDNLNDIRYYNNSRENAIYYFSQQNNYKLMNQKLSVKELKNICKDRRNFAERIKRLSPLA